MYLVTSDQMQALDNHTIHALFVPGIVLMDYAGKAVADTLRALAPRHVVVCTGKGNNGGDGWVAARWCRYYGMKVEVLALAGPSELSGDAAQAAKAAVQFGVPWCKYVAGQELPNGDVYVDALLGTGASRPLQVGVLSDIVISLNQSQRPVIAVDIPTGVNPNTGEVLGEAVQAMYTICFAAQKLGTAISPGCHFAGEVKVADIGIPIDDLTAGVVDLGSMARLTTASEVAKWLPKRVNESHKGSYGRLAIAVGEMQGAAILAGMGAARTGAGLITLMATAPLQMSSPLEFVVQVHPDGWTLPATAKALVVGPGLGQNVSRFANVLANFSGPRVIDADGLQLIENTSVCPDAAVITPHPKECAAMLGWSTEEVQAHRLDAARSLAAKTGAIVVLKGYHTLIVNPDGRVHVNPTGDASLATAGTGDVLAGMIGGLLAQSVDAFEAACAGVWLHGKAGEMAGESRTQASVVASEVVDCISRAIRSIST
ncbi:NAD(P)H-hydrate dehydratase [Alicyclobacillus mengziensis]|uniref:Bifunctional NAD(P)H-hydrate repair enzyme n=1 Tax=Alicyclobacillus mengziensis TaxID=2931921 RepID=A0A9X7VXS4_9BACL|nr:NAD(P)H-hydrate dehydratase [Alicyclobacillus mengziensis]QSO47001.1 NAD(P)H-hydrate dehydratase [Alicyclobacillus mengziensis]